MSVEQVDVHAGLKRQAASLPAGRLADDRCVARVLRRIMRALDKGKAFIVTRNGVPVGELIPLRQRMFVSTEAALAAFTDAPRVALERFRKDINALINQDPTPRG